MYVTDARLLRKKLVQDYKGFIDDALTNYLKIEKYLYKQNLMFIEHSEESKCRDIGFVTYLEMNADFLLTSNFAGGMSSFIDYDSIFDDPESPPDSEQ
jgi:hypothetical protein